MNILSFWMQFRYNEIRLHKGVYVGDNSTLLQGFRKIWPTLHDQYMEVETLTPSRNNQKN